ncbi:hypothetical protein [Motilibacter deserti]|uniref:Uncharacterized protein n=1 Tax=Motilibacter deserti TaxID=2714956 RepID=A0ABX0GNV0_9ACTN|nr:hypothetical protein [Motilibacter deserti]NHC12521.1 hypothetical protein [Motilibacter deserti]
MSTTTLRVSTETRDRINAVKGERSTDELLSEALAALERERLRREQQAALAAMTPQQWEQYTEEAALWGHAITPLPAAQ